MSDAQAFLESKRRLIERDPRAFVRDFVCLSDEIVYEVDDSGEVVGGRAWLIEPAYHWCVTTSFAFTTFNDAVIESELFSDPTQGVLVDFFACRFQARA